MHSPPVPTYRRARMTDLEAIRSAASQSWQATYEHIFPAGTIARHLEEGYSPPALGEAIMRKDSLFLVATVGECVVGYAQFAIEGDGPELLRLYVVPEYWRVGVGTRLLELIEADCESGGLRTYSCMVHSRNEAAQAFYLQHGFIRDHSRDCDDHWYLRKMLDPSDVTD